MKYTVTIGAITAASGIALAGGPINQLAYTSFENGFVGDQYVDTGDASMDHDLVNNAGQSWVDFAGSASEIGMDAYYRNTRNDVGLTDGDFVGFTDFTGTVGSFTDGVQGYEMSDADGTMGLAFAAVGSTGFENITMDLYVQETGWEIDDSIRIWAVVDGGVEIDLFSTIGQDINDLGIEGSWMAMDFALTGYTSVQLNIELESNSGSENIYIDNISWNGFIPSPGTVSLFAMGGLAATRRRRS